MSLNKKGNTDQQTKEKLLSMADNLCQNLQQSYNENQLWKLTVVISELRLCNITSEEQRLFSEICQKAQQLYQDALETAPNDATLLNNLGVLHCDGGDYHYALVNFKKALENNAEDRKIHQNIYTAEVKLHKTSQHKIPSDLQDGSRTILAYFT